MFFSDIDDINYKKLAFLYFIPLFFFYFVFFIFILYLDYPNKDEVVRFVLRFYKEDLWNNPFYYFTFLSSFFGWITAHHFYIKFNKKV